jgi:tetratricopeptide (TPR) repeat protein
MKLGMAVVLVAGFVAGFGAHAQAPAQPNKPAETQKQQNPPAQANPFPEDTNNVPVMSNGNAPVTPHVPVRESPASLPPGEADPVRSPDDPVGGADTSAEGFSSSSAGLDNVQPPPDTDIGPARGKKGRGAVPAPEHQESAAEHEKVADYYLDQKNWKAALSRYESAVVLDPENPEVYWGMGEAQRHLGKLAEAKAAYEKLVEYDPDSKHGKEARKILKSPEMANAPTASAKQP